MKSTQLDKKLLVVLYLLAFILLREWLLPVMELTEAGYILQFMIFIAISFLLAILHVKWWYVVPIKVLYIVWAVHYIFFGSIFFTKETLNNLLLNINSNIPFILNGEWDYMTNPLRTLLFFTLLWMTTVLIRHWIEVRKSILLFYIMTIIFIAFIDTYSTYNVDSAILRIMVVGLLLLGLLSLSRLADIHGTSMPARTVAILSIPLMILVVASGAVANYLPKQEPIWPDPIPFYKSLVQGTGENGTGTVNATSGYGPDDSELGGSFVQDNTVVLEAKVLRKQYWKIETKNTYTSKGWEQVIYNDTQTVYEQGVDMGEKLEAKPNGNLPLTARLTMFVEFPFILYPYGLEKVFASEGVQFLHLEEEGKYLSISNKDLNAYDIDFKEPEFSLKELRATMPEGFSSASVDFTPYLQLPEELPNRVRELALSITENQSSVYEKAKSIERYFGRSGFVYAQQDIAIPTAKEDYVDQFLFDTKKGYCDNFSTSMVVMLRAINIPARWVKGFAPGELVKDSNGDNMYRVTNNEAHSWVEAYMPGIGWLPFEPTIGFSNPTDVNFDIELDLSDPAIPEMEEQEQIKKKEAEKPVPVEKKIEANKFVETSLAWLRKHIWKVIIIVGIIALITRKVYKSRVKWLPKVLVPFRKSKTGDWNTYTKQYKSLLKQLDRLGINRTEEMTLMQYASKVDKYFGGQNMMILTRAYEKGLYGRDIVNHEWLQLQQMWEDLIIRTSG